jgi:integrase
MVFRMCEKLKDERFENSPALRFWFNSLKGNESVHSTKYSWKLHLKRFCDWIGKTPDELIAERKEQLKSEDERVKHLAEMNIKQFLRALEEKGMAANTRNSYFMAIRNFYKRNYQELYFFRGDGPGNETALEGVRAANKDDVRKMLEVSNPRIKALILFIKDTGLAETDVAKLKLKDLGIKEVAQIFSMEAPISLIVRRQKTKRLTITFVGKEAYESIKTTLRVRQQGSPEFQIRRYHKLERKAGLAPEQLGLESPLFRSYEKFFARKDMPIKHLTGHAISVMCRKAAIQAGIWKEGFSAHALRRFFQTSLETSGMNQNWIKKMMGHALEGSEKPYSDPEVQVMREAYIRAYPHLAISEAVESRSRIEFLEAQVESLQKNGISKSEHASMLEDKITSLELRLKPLEGLVDLLNTGKLEPAKPQESFPLKTVFKAERASFAEIERQLGVELGFLEKALQKHYRELHQQETKPTSQDE